MRTSEIRIKYAEFEDEEELQPGDRELLRHARQAAAKAYAPYSGFMVGAAVRLSNGMIIQGNNQENAAYPSGLCAERVVIFNAVANYPGIALTALAITAHSKQYSVDEPVFPCGACRQVMAEYETLYGQNIRLIFAGETGRIMIIEGTQNILPFQFDASHLKKT